MGDTTAIPENWPHLYQAGSSGRVLVTLHGTGGSERDILGLGTAIDPDATIVSPRGQLVEGGMLRWFRRYGEGVFDLDSVVENAAALAGFLRWAAERYGYRVEDAVGVGFSNGANIALATALLHPAELRSVVAFSGMYPLVDRSGEQQLSGSAVLLLGGDADPMAPVASGDRLVEELTARGAGVERILRPGSHGITADEVSAAQRWIGERSRRG